MTTSAGAGIRVLLYCDADLNLIDGSSIWTTSIAQVLAGDPRVQVELVLKRPVTRPLLTEPLGDLSGIALVDPFSDPRTAHVQGAWRLRGRLEPAEAVQVLAALDAQRPFELVLVRGLQLCRAVVEQPCFGGRVWAYLTDFTDEDAADVRAVCQGSARLLCQTPQIRDYLRRIAGIGEDRLLLLPPMIPDMPEEPPPFSRAGRRLVYVGKMDPLWRTEEMVSLFPRLRRRFPDAEFHIAGDKFHSPPWAGDFAERMRRLLETGSGVVWHGAMARQRALELIAWCDVGCSWRDRALETSREISTKLLEYSAQGKPPLLNKTPMHEELLGSDYPLFCGDADEFVEAAAVSFTEEAVYEAAARRAWEMARQFTFGATRQRLLPHLPTPTGLRLATAPGVHPTARGTIRLGVAGHDLRFAGPLIEHMRASRGFQVRVDEWLHHRDHDERQSREIAAWADVVIAEWCLGNAVWYSHNLPDDAKLIVRLHRVELETTYPEELDASRVDLMVCVSPLYVEKASQRLPQLQGRLTHIPQPIPCQSFDREKLVGSEFRIGMLGWSPMLKRPDLALDLLAMLQRRDCRYRLYLKGRFPTELAWLWRRDAERNYYRGLMAHLNRSPWRDSVAFDPYGEDVPVWLQKIGFILSLSDVEGCHVSVSEGMASGAVPVIRSWEGADQVYPKEYVVPDVPAAACLIDQVRTDERGIAGRAAALQEYARARFEAGKVTALWERVVRAVAASAPPLHA